MSEYKPDELRGHTYDGIEEYDNRLPNWWLFLLYGSCIFALGYWLVFHTFKIVDLPLAKYDKEMIAAAEAQLARMSEGGMTDESLILMSTMPETVADGKQLFTTYCVVCHLDQGQGLVGPNLTDRYWLHGGRPSDILRTINDGVLAKGMAAWGGQLGPTRVQKLTAYVVSIKNTDVTGKAPEGEPETADDEAADEATAEVETGNG